MADPDIYALPFLGNTLDKELSISLTIVDSKTFLSETVSKQSCKLLWNSLCNYSVW